MLGLISTVFLGSNSVVVVVASVTAVLVAVLVAAEIAVQLREEGAEVDGAPPFARARFRSLSRGISDQPRRVFGGSLESDESLFAMLKEGCVFLHVRA